MSRWRTKYSYYLQSIWRLLHGFDSKVLIIRIFTGSADAGITTVRVRHADVRFRVRNAMDVWSVKETFLDRFYERYGFVIRPGWTVFDIGGGIGEFGLFAARAEPGTQVYAFEPFPEAFALMWENMRLNDVTNAQLHEMALGAESGTSTLDLSSGDPVRFQTQAAADLATTQHLEVTLVSLGDALNLTGVDEVDLLKLDCEGAEYDILFNSVRSVLERIHRIVMEFHDDVTDYSHTDLVRFLNDAGYEVETFPNPVHASIGYLRAIHEQ